MSRSGSPFSVPSIPAELTDSITQVRFGVVEYTVKYATNCQRSPTLTPGRSTRCADAGTVRNASAATAAVHLPAALTRTPEDRNDTARSMHLAGGGACESLRSLAQHANSIGAPLAGELALVDDQQQAFLLLPDHAALQAAAVEQADDAVRADRTREALDGDRAGFLGSTTSFTSA